jgi:dihydroorotate dehydrogenase (fumarate)
MANLSTTFMGLELKNPFIVGASGYTANVDRIKKLEEAGAAAIVTASLFEEQIQHERFRLEEDLHQFDNLYGEMTTFFPQVQHAGPKEHLGWVRKAKQSVGIPVIASLNAVNPDIWVEWAQQLAATGVDGLELNFYSAPTELDRSGAQIEEEQLEVLKSVKKKVGIPICVKLSHFYTNPLQLIKKLDDAGVDGFVLFNRFFQPDINAEQEKNRYAHSLSEQSEHRIPLRFTGLLFGQIKGDICANSGIHSATDALKLLLAGSSAVEVVSTLYRNKIAYLGTLIRDTEQWMDQRGYKAVSAFKGKMSAKSNRDAGFYRRAQYVKDLLKADYAG